ncbi:hypothetical protein [Vibrio sp. qd031]|uniref:hypothetical protein n=1 Tax=Vibrio sp. qd031 TaxID=1603038 RepID=UPI00117EA1DF|nr:hypothetical protein [Vibrio sp. qd031]
MIKKLLQPIPSAGLAALGYGGWAFWVQDSQTFTESLSAAMVQGSFAFLSTLFLGQVARWLFLRFQSKLVVFICCSLLLCTVPSLLHTINHSQQILFAILPGLIVGHLYLCSLLWFQLDAQELSNRQPH